MTRSRRCGRPGCRAWAMRGQDYCRAHVGSGALSGQGSGLMRREEPGQAGQELIEQRLLAVLARTLRGEAGQELLAEEIGALRLVLARLLAEEEDPSRLAASVPRVVDAVVRAARAQQALSGTLAEDLTEAMTQILIELGLGGD